MKIVAIHPGHNSTAALMIDGKLIATVSQEKFDNVKNSAAFPADAIDMCLSIGGIDRKDVDKVVVAGQEIFPESCYAYLFARGQRNTAPPEWKVSLAKSLENGAIGKALPVLFQGLRSHRRNSLLEQGKAEFMAKLQAMGLPHDTLEHVDHHECHARSAFHALDDNQGAEPALILTLDGSGDGIAGSVTTWHPQKGWERIATIPMEASLGGYYSNTTRFLGMNILEHEYKVMGLSAYCKSYYRDVYDRLFAPVVWQDPDNPLTFRSKVDATRFYDYLAKNAVGERFDNIAGAIQALVEERVVAWTKAAVAHTGIKRVFTGGGVFMNVKLNKCLQELEELDSIRFMPSCGDESNPIGAVYATSVAAGVPVQPISDIYLGPSYARDTLAAFVGANASAYTVMECSDIEQTIADLLARGEVVARFAGRCEWGARSLGNRAILAHPSRMESFYAVNDQIKARDFWMPFAPSILDRRAADYLKGYDPVRTPAPYMITAFEASELGVDHLRAAMHQGDHTLRPQVVTPTSNPSYYRLIELFEQRTGVGGVMNTSFNLHGYPLVATPEQAVFTLERTGLRHLALGPFLITKDGGAAVAA